jgi:hypothetical protein
MSRHVHRFCRGALALAVGLHGTAALCNTITVNTAADPGLAGECSLRVAITAANANSTSQGCSTGGGASDTIQFNISPSGVKTITLQSMTPLPEITAPVTIDGYTQPGSAANNLASASNAVPGIVINGVNSGGIGLRIGSGGSGSTIRGLVIQNFADGGILIDASSNNTVAGNFIGTNSAGTAGAGNGNNNFAGGLRVLADAGGEFANNNLIGGVAPADRNVISGNSGQGISLFAFTGGVISGTNIFGNVIGSNKAGTSAATAPPLHNNGRGITISGASNTTIGNATSTTPGGACSGGCNLLAANFGKIGIENADGLGTVSIVGNYIGTNAAGSAAMTLMALPNSLSGILISGANGTSINIGGATAGERNIISGSTDKAIDIQNFFGTIPITIRGNYIGTNAAGTLAIPNNNSGIHVQNTTGVVIGGTAAGQGNLISGNTYFGISLEGGVGTLIQGNRIGTQADGTSPLGNGRRGINIMFGSIASDNNIIGAQAGQTTGGNTIAFNGENDLFPGGIQVSSGVGNRISRNAIYSNKNVSDGLGMGIDIHGDGPSANDGCDVDAGVNNLQNNPTNLIVGAGGTTVSGRFRSTPSTQFTLEFYASPAEPFADSLLEGKLFVGATVVNTSVAPDCLATFSDVALTTPVPAGHVLTGLAIAANGDTSEFTWVPDNLFSDGFE